MSSRIPRMEICNVIHYQPAGAKPFTEHQRYERRKYLRLKREPIAVSGGYSQCGPMAMFKETEIHNPDCKGIPAGIPRCPDFYAIEILTDPSVMSRYKRTVYRTADRKKALKRWGIYTVGE